MADLMSLMVRIGADTQEAERGISKVSKLGNTLSKGLKTAAKGATIAVGAATAAVGALVKSAVDSYARYEQLVGGVETLYKTSSDTVQEYAKNAYKTAGLSANDYMEQATSFAAALVNSLGGNTEEAARRADMAITDMSDNANKMGTSMESLQNAYSGFAKGNFTMLDNLKLGYGGTKEEMQRLLDKAEEISGYKYDISSYADIVEAIHVVQDELGITNTTVEEADKTIQGSLAATKAAWENVMVAIAGGNLDLGESIDALVESGINTINNIWPAISRALRGVGELVKQVAPIIAENLPGMVQDVLPNLLDAAITLLGGVASALPGLFQVVLDAVGELFGQLKSYIDEKNPELGEKISAIADFFVSAWETISAYWTDTLQPALAELWTYVTDELVPAVTNAWEQLQPKIEAVFNALKDFWVTTLEPIYQSMKTWIVDDLIPKLQEAWEGIKEKVTDVFNGLATLWDEVLKPIYEGIKIFLEETLQPVFENVFNAISTIVDTTFNGIDAIWNGSVKPIYEGILTFFDGVFKGDFDTAWQGIKDIVQGVWDGIQIAAETVWENAKTWGSTIVDNFSIAFNNAWALVKDSVLGLWDGLTDKVAEIWESAKKWGTNIIANFWTSINNAWSTAIEWIKGLFKQIPDAIQELVDSALNWGRDLIDNFKRGIEEKWEGLKQKVSDVAGSIADFLGFSVPKKGPLSDFDTYSPDMMDLFINGIRDSMGDLVQTIYNVAQRVQDMFRVMGENAANAFTSSLSDIQSIVARAFDFSGIHVKTPHFYVTRWSNVANTMIPSFAVQWYRKAYENPVMFTSPTVLSTTSGLKGFGDGNGGEIVLSDKKLREIAGNGATYNNTFNVYAQPGQDAEEIAREVQKIFVGWDNQAKAVFA